MIVAGKDIPESDWPIVFRLSHLALTQRITSKQWEDVIEGRISIESIDVPPVPVPVVF